MSEKKLDLSQNSLQEEYEDLVFKKVMDSYCEKESREILDEIENEADRQEPDMKLFNRLMRKSQSKQTLKTVVVVFKKTLVYVSVFFFVCVLSFSSVLAVSAEAREYVKEALYHLIFEYDERYTAVGIGKPTGFVDPHLYTWEGAYAPTYIPEGYVYSEEYSDTSGGSDMSVIICTDGDKILSFLQGNDSSIAYIDTENADRVEHIVIGESEALLVVKGNRTHVVWSHGSTMLSVKGYESPEEIIKVAEGIKIFK